MVGRGKWHLAGASGIQQGSPTGVCTSLTVPAVVETGAVSQATLAREARRAPRPRCPLLKVEATDLQAEAGKTGFFLAYPKSTLACSVFSRSSRPSEAIPPDPAGAASRPLGLGGRGSWSAVAASEESRLQEGRAGVGCSRGGTQARSGWRRRLWRLAIPGGRPSNSEVTLPSTLFEVNHLTSLGASGCWF